MESRVMLPAADLREWMPIAAAWREGALVADLCRIGERAFTEPFFEDTVAAAMRQPFNAVFRRQLDVATLARWLERSPPLPLGGFVFHMSRCGSTLLSQVLAAWPGHRVLAEPPPIDAAVRGGVDTIGDATRTAALRTIVGMLAQPGRPGLRRCFVKFDSWHARRMPLILRAFPDVPWIFLVRDPVEVIVSHLRRPGAQMVAGALDPAGRAVREGREVQIARVLASICEAAEQAIADAPAPGLVIDYADLVPDLETRALPHFGLHVDADRRALVTAALARDAKNPAFAFAGDREDKQRAATPAARAASDSIALDVYRRLLQRARGA